MTPLGVRLRRALSKRRGTWRAYQHLDYMQAALLADVLAGRLKFQHRRSWRPSHTQDDYYATNADVRVEIDYPKFMGGTFSYLWIGGVDYVAARHSAEDDWIRVVRAVALEYDPGPTDLNDLNDLNDLFNL